MCVAQHSHGEITVLNYENQPDIQNRLFEFELKSVI